MKQVKIRFLFILFNVVFTILLGLNQNLSAQGRRSIEINQRRWVFNDSLSLLFLPNGQVQIENDKVGLVADYGLSQCMYDSTDLKPLFYSGGQSLYDSTNTKVSSTLIPWPFLSDRCTSFLFPTLNDSIYYYYSRTLASQQTDEYKVKITNGMNAFLIDEISYQSIVPRLLKSPAIKHGNGRDFWVISHGDADYYYRELVVDGQFVSVDTQHIGVFGNIDSTGIYSDFCFSPSGTKFAAAIGFNGVQVYDFDRCTGLLSNEKVIFGSVDLSIQFPSRFHNVAFSPNEKYLYVGANGGTHEEWYQVNLDPQMDEDTILIMYQCQRVGGPINYWFENSLITGIVSPAFVGIQLAQNNKIYLSSYWGGTLINNPTPDSLSSFIGVINEPDSVFPACMFNPYEIWCNAAPRGESARVLNYKMGPLLNSPCDTLSSTTGIANLEKDIQFKVFPNPANDKINITWPVQGGYTWVLKSLAGSTLSSGTLQAGNATISTSNLPEGMYFLEVHSAMESKVEKVIIVR